MRVLVTGAAGFIGSHVTRRLVSEGCEVWALVRPGADLRRIADVAASVRVVPADLQGPPDALTGAVAGLSVDTCMHMAWYAEPGKYLSDPANLAHVSGSLALMQQLAARGCRRFVGAGTCFEYDLETGAETLGDTSPTHPRTLYAACKHAVATIGEQWAALANVSFAWGRIFYPYGPGEDPRKVILSIISKLVAGQPCELTSGEQVRDYIHVEDVAAAFWTLASSAHVGPVAVGSGQPVTIAEIARTLGELLGRGELLRLGALPSRVGDPARVCADNRGLRALGWRPRYDLRAGLAQTIAWYTGTTREEG